MHCLFVFVETHRQTGNCLSPFIQSAKGPQTFFSLFPRKQGPLYLASLSSLWYNNNNYTIIYKGDLMRRISMFLLCVLCALLFFAAAPAPAPSYDGLRISEVMVKNKASLLDENGAFSDWIEIENAGSAPVDLSGWALSDRAGSPRLPLPAQILQPGEYALVFCTEDSFSLSRGETVYLFSPDRKIRDSLLCPDDTSDASLARQSDGSFLVTDWISPGYPNTAAGYESFCSARRDIGPLLITEVVVHNESLPLYWSDGEAYDWVEIQNVSDTAIELGGCMLTDNADRPDKYVFPEGSIEPGERKQILCASERVQEEWMYPALNTYFDLDSLREELYLYRADGTLSDYAALHDIPANGSLGREAGRGGFLYYITPAPGQEKSGGIRRVAAAPVVVEGDGVFDGVQSVAVSFSAPGEIHYEFGGDLPSWESPLYTGPITATETCVVRAVAFEYDALPSPPATCTVILNEGHSLPVLSLVVDDSWNFKVIYDNGWRGLEYSANLALYDGEHSFSHACGAGMRGWTSLELPKKSMGVVFRGRYGGDLEADVFGNGITQFHSLAIRGGQDYTFTIFRNELCQDLCLEACPSVLSQASKFCVLYLNGEYWGIYCLKEDVSRSYYAIRTGVSKASVSNLRGPVSIDSDLFLDVLQFCRNNDLSLEENYRYICSQMDIDSLIDWFLLESYCNNTDIQGNVRYMRSPESGNRWQMVFYDLDWTFGSGIPFSPLLEGEAHTGDQMPLLIGSLCRNAVFREKVLARYGQLVNGTLSDEHVLTLLDNYVALLEPEVARDRERWGLNLNAWYENLDTLRSLIQNNYARYTASCLCNYLHAGSDEQAQYFGY